jgi:hypothetical protein
MQNFYDIPLKVLWIFNVNEADIAVDFCLEEGGKSYQVKGSGAGAFDNNGKLRICLTDNLNSVFTAYPNRSVLIADESKYQKIWNYWKKETGEKRYNALHKEWEEYNARLQKSFFDEEPQPATVVNENKEVTLSATQINNLVFEIETLIQMQKVFKGEISKPQVEALLNASSQGFSEATKKKITEEIKRKGLL